MVGSTKAGCNSFVRMDRDGPAAQCRRPVLARHTRIAFRNQKLTAAKERDSKHRGEERYWATKAGMTGDDGFR